MTLLLWVGLWFVVSFAVAPLLGAFLKRPEPPATPLPVTAGTASPDVERQLRRSA